MKHYLFLFSLVFLFSCSLFKGGQKDSGKTKMIPSEFSNTYLGMPLADFKNARAAATLNSEMDFRTVYLENFNEGDIKTAIYYFGTKDNLPLYEYIFDYHSKEKRDAFIEKNLGAPNDGEEWRFKGKDGFDIRAWTYKNKLILTGLIKDTEWYNEENED